MVTVLTVVDTPTISPAHYMDRLRKYTYPLPDVLDHALHLTRRLSRRTPVDEMEMHRALLGCFFIASKVLEDDTFTLQYMARVGGVSCPDLVEIERFIIDILEWDVSVPY